MNDASTSMKASLFSQLEKLDRPALVAEWIRQEPSEFELPAFRAARIDLEAIREASLDGAWTNLNRLQQTDPKAFECWHAAQGMKKR